MANEGIELDVYRYSAPTVRVTTLHGRVGPTSLTEMGDGAGSFKISISDPQIVADPTLLDYRNIYKIKINGLLVNAWFNNQKTSTTIGSGEKADELYTISGVGLRGLLDDGIILPYGGLRADSTDNRYFGFSSPRGSWYVTADWHNSFQVADALVKAYYIQTDWPVVAAAAKWIWGTAETTTGAAGDCYFRLEFTTTGTADATIYIGSDNDYQLFLDGQQISTGGSNFNSTAKVSITAFNSGDHVLAAIVTNAAGGAINPGGLRLAITQTPDVGVETLIAYSTTAMQCQAYPTKAPGWNVGQILTTLLSEAHARGVAFTNFVTWDFTETHDSNGTAWPDADQWSFTVGAKLTTAFAKLEELVCTYWIDPDTYVLHCAPQRGVDRSVFGSGVTPSSVPVVFAKGKNLTKAETTGKGLMVNSLAVKLDTGWSQNPAQDAASITKYGVLEDSINTGAAVDIAMAVAAQTVADSATPEEGATYEFIVTDKVPYVDFHEGDWVLAPDAQNLSVRRQVMSISVGENADTGAATYAIEFDTIFQSEEARVAGILSKTGNGGVGGSLANSAGNGSNPITPIVTTPTTPTVYYPKLPVDLAVTSVGSWSADGVTPSSTATVTWDPVTQNTDGSPVVVEGYEVWGHLTSAGADGYAMWASTPTNSATIPQLVPGSWTFRVRVNNQGVFSDWSAEIVATLSAPVTPMYPPTTPILTTDSGNVHVGWDGLLTNGGVTSSPPPQFRYIYAEVAAHGSSTYTQAGPVMQRNGKAITISGLTVGTQYDFKLIAVDGVGIASAASSLASITVLGVDLGDLSSAVTDAISAAAAAAKAAQDSDNLLGDSSFEANNELVWSWDPTSVTNVTTNPRSGLRNLTANSTTSAYEILHAVDAIPCDPGDNFYFRIYVEPEDTSGTDYVAGGIELNVLYGATESSTTTQVAIGASADLDITQYDALTGTWLVPDGVYFFRPSIWMRDTTGDNIYYLDDIRSYKMTDTETLVNGSVTTDIISADAITADKMAADSITADSILAGAVTAGKIDTDAVTADNILAGSITTDKVAAGAITTELLDAGVGGSLDISANSTVTIIAGQIDTAQGTADDAQTNLEALQTYYSFGADGALISTPSSPFTLQLDNDSISMLENGNVVSYWNSGQMFVNSFVGTEVVLGNHKIEAYGTGTVVKAL